MSDPWSPLEGGGEGGAVTLTGGAGRGSGGGGTVLDLDGSLP